MSDLDLFISNGTCYFATNRKAADTFIPCGNAANAAYTCCLKGDVCLEGSVCFHPDGNSGGTTYIAGCTDPGFGSVAGACPHKGKFADQQIVGLVRCQDSDDNSKPDELWAGCTGDATKTEMTGVPPPCSCSDPDYQGLFRQKPTIEAVATLPTALGQTVLFANGHEPAPSFKQMTSSRTGGGSKTVAPSSVITINVPSHAGSPLVKTARITTSASFTPTDVPVSAAKASDEPGHGLSTGAKAGIAVGVILAVLVSSAFFFLAMTMRRRHRKLSEDIVQATATKTLTPTDDNTPGAMTAAHEPPPLSPPAAPSWANSNSSGRPSIGAAGTGNHVEEWFKPELPADSSTIVSVSPDLASAATGGAQMRYFDSRVLHPSGHLQSQCSRRDSRESNTSVSDMSSSYYYQGNEMGGTQGRGSAAKAMASISELQG